MARCKALHLSLHGPPQAPSSTASLPCTRFKNLRGGQEPWKQGPASGAGLSQLRFHICGDRSRLRAVSTEPLPASGQFPVSHVKAPLGAPHAPPGTPTHLFNDFTFYSCSGESLTSGDFFVQLCENSWGQELQSLPTCLKGKIEGEQTLINISINYPPVLTQTSSCVFARWFIFWVLQTHFPSRYWIVWLSLGGVWLFIQVNSRSFY